MTTMTTNKRPFLAVHRGKPPRLSQNDDRMIAKICRTVQQINLPESDDPIQIFKALAQQTLPAGNEEWAYRETLEELGFEYVSGIGARLEIPHPSGKLSTTAFTSHMDDVSGEVTRIKLEDRVWGDDREEVLQNGYAQIIGADCRAGVALMLSMVKRRVPGRYLIFEAEEIGLVGSSKAAEDGWGKGIKRMVSFDRKDTSDVITHMRGGRRTASEEFAIALSNALNAQGLEFSPCDSGSATDSFAFVDEIPECTNIAVGYHDAHTVFEFLRVNHLRKLTDACCNIHWDKLPAKRNPKEYEQRAWTHTGTVDGVLQENGLIKWPEVEINAAHGSAEVYDFMDSLNRSPNAEELSIYLKTQEAVCATMISLLRQKHPQVFEEILNETYELGVQCDELLKEDAEAEKAAEAEEAEEEAEEEEVEEETVVPNILSREEEEKK